MKLAIDVFYYEQKAKIVGVLFERSTDIMPMDIITKVIPCTAEYEPGAFYKRELPCILSLLEEVDLKTLDCIIIDGYVYLDSNRKKGLGGYLYEVLVDKLPIIGIAKSYFFRDDSLVSEVLRGDSLKPLYVTAIGMELKDASVFVQSMNGKYRMPTLLQIMDTETKKI
ncbi:endonuclease V [Myroides odoratimimus]|uniref:endonuclease V n=1 Tax=Myroides odoratimimus TaxID=76832 RepID=UPI002576C362|nr:endonuclease V [Myroides odoratimimus]MDM1096376.1 endonuclease V [Myroides odoratimimus]